MEGDDQEHRSLVHQVVGADLQEPLEAHQLVVGGDSNRLESPLDALIRVLRALVEGQANYLFEVPCGVDHRPLSGFDDFLGEFVGVPFFSEALEDFSKVELAGVVDNVVSGGAIGHGLIVAHVQALVLRHIAEPPLRVFELITREA